MDKQISGLDPKLKEIYDRVMNTTVNTAQITQPAAPSPQPQPVQQTTPQQAPAAQQTAPTAQTIPQAPESAFISSLSNVATTDTETHHGLSPILLAIFAIAFLSVYTLIWIKLFRIQVPFLPF